MTICCSLIEFSDIFYNLDENGTPLANETAVHDIHFMTLPLGYILSPAHFWDNAWEENALTIGGF